MCQGLNITLIRLASLFAWSFCSVAWWHSSFSWDLSSTLNPSSLNKGLPQAFLASTFFEFIGSWFPFSCLEFNGTRSMWLGKGRLCLVLSHWTPWTRTAQIRPVWCIHKTWSFRSWPLSVGDQSFPSFYLDPSLFQFNNHSLPGLHHVPPFPLLHSDFALSLKRLLPVVQNAFSSALGLHSFLLFKKFPSFTSHSFRSPPPTTQHTLLRETQLYLRVRVLETCSCTAKEQFSFICLSPGN